MTGDTPSTEELPAPIRDLKEHHRSAPNAVCSESQGLSQTAGHPFACAPDFAELMRAGHVDAYCKQRQPRLRIAMSGSQSICALEPKMMKSGCVVERQTRHLRFLQQTSSAVSEPAASQRGAGKTRDTPGSRLGDDFEPILRLAE